MPLHSATLEAAAQRWFGKAAGALTAVERNVLQHLLHRDAIAEDAPHSTATEASSLGDRLADQVARFGGSWTFIGLFALVLVGWAVLNTIALRHPFDPYPFVFLNLMLSMLAAVQAPIIMMSQNRQAAKDRAQADSDYQVNLKAEMEIMALHDKLDALRVDRLEALLLQQAEQIAALRRLLHASGP